MSHATPSDSPLGIAGDAPESESLPLSGKEEPQHEPRNFFCLAMHLVLIRVGWVFKTESIVMPYFLDLVGGTPMLRGCLMVFNRFGFSVPPVLFARALNLMPQKRWAVAWATFGMSIPFALLSWVWWTGAWRDESGDAVWWMPYLFLTAYALFFIITGLNQLSVHSLQGKLIRENVRGRLFAAVMLIGSPLAIGAAWWLMPRWLALEDGGFVWLFGAPAVMFALASLAMLGVTEKNDEFSEPRAAPWRRMHEAWRIAYRPGPCQGVAIVAMLYSTHFMLFPHYQALARENAGVSFDLQSLMLWTVTQHLAVTIFSLLAGPLADRFGNRLAVQLTVFGSTLSPLTAIFLASMPSEAMSNWFWLVFVPLGFTPVTMKMMINYTLELVEREEHPRHVAALGVCLAMPVIIGSPILGVLVGWLGSLPVFVLGAVVMLSAGTRTLRLIEPRNGEGVVSRET